MPVAGRRRQSQGLAPLPCTLSSAPAYISCVLISSSVSIRAAYACTGCACPNHRAYGREFRQAGKQSCRKAAKTGANHPAKDSCKQVATLSTAAGYALARNLGSKDGDAALRLRQLQAVRTEDTAGKQVQEDLLFGGLCLPHLISGSL